MVIHKSSEFNSNNATTRLLLALWDMGDLVTAIAKDALMKQIVKSGEKSNVLPHSEDKYTIPSTDRKAIGGWITCATFLLAIIPTTAMAQSIPQSDRNGNYFRNETPVLASKRINPGSLWSVVSKQLNCRLEPSLTSPVSQIYKAGDLLEVEVGRGGSDEVLLNAIDSHGKPWMPVRRG